jgi:hypothetical protein
MGPVLSKSDPQSATAPPRAEIPPLSLQTVLDHESLSSSIHWSTSHEPPVKRKPTNGPPLVPLSVPFPIQLEYNSIHYSPEKFETRVTSHVKRSFSDGYKFINQYRICRSIGEGRYARVFECENSQTQEKFVCRHSLVLQFT